MKLNANNPLESGKTLKELMDEHLGDCEVKGLSFYTLKSYKDNARIVLKYLDGNMNLSSITNQTINQLISEIKSTGVKPTTINNRLRYLKALFNYAYDNDYMSKLKIKSVKVDEENKNPLNDDEVARLIKKPSSDDYVEYRQWVIVNLILATGIRTRNVLELFVSDVNFKNGTLHLRLTKSRKSQTIYLTPSISKILKEWLRLTNLKDQQPMFPTVYGETMSRYTYRSAFDNYVDRRRVDCTPHQLSHTFTKSLVINNVNPFVIKEMLGHSDISVTQKYVKMFGEDLQQATQGIDTLAQYQKSRIKLGGSK